MAELGANVGLGLAFTALGMAAFIPEWINKAKEDQDKDKIKVQFRTALPVIQPEDQGDEHRKENIYKEVGYGGDIPNVSLFGPNGDRIGYYNGGGKAQTDDVVVVNLNPVGGWKKASPEYISVSASGADAICITGITIIHPTTEIKYSFVPGEIAVICNTLIQDDGAKYPVGESATSYKFEKDGQEHIARPRCLALDKTDEQDGKIRQSSTRYEGFTARIIDFKPDNAIFQKWEDDLGQMCNSKARFAMWEKLNEMQYPQIFSPAPDAGVLLPYKEVTPAHPDIWHSFPYDDPKLTKKEAEAVYIKLGRKDPTHTTSPVPGPLHKARSLGSGTDQVVRARRSQKVRNTQANHDPVHKQSVEPRDVQTSAIERCADENTQGPDLFSPEEQMFCATNRHVLFPACIEDLPTPADCFDQDKEKIRYAGDMTAREGTAAHGSFNYPI